MLKTKNSTLPIKAEALKEDGSFEGYLSIFGNVDSYGEMVMPGAFTASLVAARQKGSKIKLLWQHDPAQPIGVWQDLAEDSKGLYAKGQLLIDACEQRGIPFLPWFPLGGGPSASPVEALVALLRRSPVMLPIPGTSSVAHLEENMRAAELA